MEFSSSKLIGAMIVLTGFKTIYVNDYSRQCGIPLLRGRTSRTQLIDKNLCQGCYFQSLTNNAATRIF